MTPKLAAAPARQQVSFRANLRRSFDSRRGRAWPQTTYYAAVHRNTHAVEIERPAAEIFPYLVEAEKRTQWVQGLVESKPLDGGQLGVGTRFRDVVVDHGQRTVVAAEIERYEPNERMTARLEARGFVSRLSYELEDSNGRTTVDCAVETEFTMRIARLLSPIVVKHAQKAIENSLATLKRQLEA
jgi:uncharacterized protein YndB with AHSA1/START domain